MVGQTQVTEGSGPCAAAGRFVIEVTNKGDQARRSPAPLELSLVIEPPVTNAAALPVLADGRYTDTMAPGEEAYFRVPLTYGQRLAYRIEVPALSEADRATLDGARLNVSSSILSPENPRVLGDFPDYAWKATLGDRPQSYTGASVPVAYRNRESDEDYIRDTTLPGYYKLWVRLFTDQGAADVKVPITLTVDVQGEPAGVPTYHDTMGYGPPDRQQGLTLTPDTGPVTLAPAVPTASVPATAPVKTAAATGPIGSTGPLPLLLAISTAALALVTAFAIWMVRRAGRSAGRPDEQVPDQP
ncbi:hypothetical protein AB0C27_14640 [Nonomuraea sp. NPDC048882]|uniref:hypothetical protein n=1 Tax=Nonomuraea sp. NPDC048882 TaxID=3154347 RepID=UPI0033E59305